MYNYIAIMLCVMFAITSFIMIKDFKKNIVNPLFIFNVLWALILSLNALHLFELNVSEDKIYLNILFGIIFFNVGYFIMYAFNRKYRLIFSLKSIKLKQNFYKDYLIRYNLLCILGCICIVYYLKNFGTVCNLLLQGNDLSVIRAMAQDSESILNVRSNVENALRILVILPFCMALETIVAVDFWNGKRHKPLLFICIVIIFLRVITDGGRTPIVNFTMYMIVSYILSKSTKKEVKIKTNKNKNKKWHLIIGIILAAIILYYTTLSRDGENALRTVYYYFAMEPYMFNVWANTIEDSGLVGLGLASMNGFIFPVLYLIKNFLGIKFPEYWSKIYDMILLTDSQWKVITQTGISANAYVSMFWFFYFDGRILGIIVGMLSYGMVLASSYISALKHKTCKNICIYALIFQGLFFSFIRFPFSNIYYSLAFLFIVLVAYKAVEVEITNE